uniref:Replication factor C subunit 1 n=2 Tax=Parascaris univalens TaxID=6257 RepID=A0A914ZRW0_PARUN
MSVEEGGSSGRRRESVKVAISDEEKAVYDRQIRLWGLEAQNRLRNSSVLIAGLSGCGAEVAKNLMLAGLKSITLLDHRKVTEMDESNQFFIAPGSIGQNRAEASRERCYLLNPHVMLQIDTSEIATKNDDFFKQFDLVVLIDQKYSVVNKVDRICRSAQIRFAAGGVFGWTGYGFFDFNGYTFLMRAPKRSGMDSNTVVLDRSSDGYAHSEKRPRCDIRDAASADNGAEHPETIDIDDDEDERIKMKVPYPSWEETLNVDWTQKKLIRKSKRILPNCYFPIRALLRAYDTHEEVSAELALKLWKEEMENCNRNFEIQAIDGGDATFFMDPPFSPACAIVGAVIGQEVVKALSQNEEPLRNLFLYSALETAGIVCNFPPLV